MNPEDVDSLAVNAPLPDGTTVNLRPVVPSDKQLLADGFRRLSPESRFLRFFSPVSSLSEAQLRYFTEIDYEDHFAFVALIDGVGVGVARYIRLRTDPTAAEAAVAVADDFHRRGIGTVLLEALAAAALGHGVRAFHLLVHVDNHPMIAAMDDIGAVVAPNDEHTVIRYVLDLPTLSDDVRGTAMWKVFRIVGEGTAQLHSTLSNHVPTDSN